MVKQNLSLLLFCLMLPSNSFFSGQEAIDNLGQAVTWGFFGHKHINQMSVYLLPPELFPFYKHHIQFIIEQAVSPDERRYAVEGEAPRHYIDLDEYGKNALDSLPRTWEAAVAKLGEDTLMAYGIVPWHIANMHKQLTFAFRQMDTKRILRISAELGHYIGDANVPLHTTKNYNGQLTDQYGIHGLWESRLPELFSSNYDFFFDEKASYIPDPQAAAWQAVAQANAALDSVFRMEKEATSAVGLNHKYAIEERNGNNQRTYSQTFCKHYHQMLNGQVERQMRRSVKMVADFWFTAWVNAGRPPMHTLLDYKMTEAEKMELENERKEWLEKKTFTARPHE